MTVRRAALALVGGAVVLSGCADRRLVAAPSSSPGTGTWAVVTVAGGLIAVVAGLLVTLPAWRGPARHGGRLATAVLTAQAGVATVVGAVLVGVAVRSWQLIERPPDDAPAVALLRLSRIDGDTAFFALMVLTVVVMAVPVVALLAAAARLSVSYRPLERWVACSVLAIELVGCAFAAVLMVLLDDWGWPFLGPSLAFPLIAVAFASCWPSRGLRESAT